MAASWRPGCPVHHRDLRTVELNHLGFDGKVHRGRLVVHREVVTAVVRVFDVALATRFPVRSVRPVDEFGADDGRSMAADNTSAFNCRRTTNGTSWSAHAYGRAVDLNPVENPYVHRPSGSVQPAAGRAYLDRRRARPGMLVASSPVVRAFAAQGFRWLGTYDYQHFERR